MSSSKMIFDLKAEDIQAGISSMGQESLLSFLDELVNDLEYIVTSKNFLIDYKQVKRKLIFIIETISIKLCRLLNAERVTIYLVEKENNLLRTVNAIGPDGQKISFKISMDEGIAGYVARTSEVLNITDPYNDQRFNRTIDEKTGFRTRNIFCLPILNSTQETIAVAQALNKVGGGQFTDHDIEEFTPFSNSFGAVLEQIVECDRLIPKEIENQRSVTFLRFWDDMGISL